MTTDELTKAAGFDRPDAVAGHVLEQLAVAAAPLRRDLVQRLHRVERLFFPNRPAGNS